MAKPDDRRDNVEKIQRSIDNTIENHEEAEDYLAAHGDDLPPEQVEAIREKNLRRHEAVEGFREEIQDEAEARRRR